MQNSELWRHNFLRVHSADVGHKHLQITSPWQGRNHASKVRGSESGEARIEGEAQERAGEGVWGGDSVSPPQKIFGISNLKSFNLV